MFSGGSSNSGAGAGRDDNETLTRLTHMMMMMPVPPQQPVTVVVGGVGDAERMPMWSEQETRVFILIRSELERDFNVAKRNKGLWEVVAVKMKDLGYTRTPDQCKCKWKNLVNRYKGKETLDRDNSRSFPFFDELHVQFSEKTTNTPQPQTPFYHSTTSSQSKKRVTITDSYQSLDEISEDEYEIEENKITKNAIPPLKKPKREKRAQTSSQDPGSNSNSVREILHDFFQQQEMIEMQWRQLTEKHAYERHLSEQQWRQSMERLETEKMRIDQSWREKEEQRKTREESRAERRDALLTLLLNKLVHEQ